MPKMQMIQRRYMQIKEKALILPHLFPKVRRRTSHCGEIILQATVQFDKGDVELIVAELEKRENCKIRISSLPKQFPIVRKYIFENSDFVEKASTWSVNLLAKAHGEQKFVQQGSGAAIWKSFVAITIKKLPQIVYFPTFLFAQPSKVVLNPSAPEEVINRQYREIIENVARSLAKPLDVKKHIVERIVNPETLGEKVFNYFSLAASKREQVEAVISELFATFKNRFELVKIFGNSFDR